MVQKNSVVSVLKILRKSISKKSMLEGKRTKETKFQILISTILSARARDSVTIPLSEKLFKSYPDAKSLAAAKKRDVEKLIKRIGFYKNKAKNVINTSKIIHNKFKDRVPESKQDLLSLPGVGSKVANCVLVYAFSKDAIPVDTHVHKVSNRLGWVKTNNPKQTEKILEKIVPRKYWSWVNELFVLHGQDVCKSIPLCSKCAIFKYCKRIGVRKSR